MKKTNKKAPSNNKLSLPSLTESIFKLQQNPIKICQISLKLHGYLTHISKYLSKRYKL